MNPKERYSDMISIGDNEAKITVVPELTYKVMRIINHFIDELMKNYEDEDNDITYTSSWYTQWKQMYPLIKSSKRTVQEIYRVLSNDYSKKDSEITPLMVVMNIIDTVPFLTHCYDITPVEGQEDGDPNCFRLSVNLYHRKFNDPNNIFNVPGLKDLDESVNLRPFTDSKSITSWKTSDSQTSSIDIPPEIETKIETKMEAQAPDETVTTKNDDIANTDGNPSPKSKDDTNITYSTPPMEKPLDKQTAKNSKKTQSLKDAITDSTRKHIKLEMEEVRNSLNVTISQQMKQLTTMMEKSTLLPSTRHTPTPSLVTSRSSTKSRNMPSPNTKVNFLPTPQHNPYSQTHNQHHPYSHSQQNFRRNNNPYNQYQRSGSLNFIYNNAEYELRDMNYVKYASDLRAVNSKEDLVNFYEELQADAITYNILIQQFDLLTPWIKYSTNSLPPTCMLTTLTPETNTINAYNRMKNAVFTKLSKSEINEPQYKAIIKHGSIGKDGFEVLYELMTHCHPKLMVATTKVRSTNQRPELDTGESIYEFVEKLEAWLTIEAIKGLNYSDDMVLDIVMEQMRSDSKYELAIQSINSELVMKDVYTRQFGSTVFPEHLKLYNLPGTILSYYPTEERAALFPPVPTTSAVVNRAITTSSDENSFSNPTEMAKAIIQSMTSTDATVHAARESIDETCEGCGMFAHNVYQTGCDKCAQFILIKRFLEKNNNAVKPILSKYRQHQRERAANRRKTIKSKTSQQETSSEKPRRSNNTRSKARVQKLQSALEAVFEDSDGSEDSTTSYQDAQSYSDEDQE